jgi:hydroxyethylthiazole kinase-like uncharacterized protein yjeF
MTGSVPLTPEVLRRHPIPGPEQQGDKEDRGRVLVVAGSVEAPGAALLAGEGALRVGAGKVQIAAPASIASGLAAAFPEARVFGLEEGAGGKITAKALDVVRDRSRSCQSVLIGPGMVEFSTAASLRDVVLRAAADPPIVLDAAALADLTHSIGELRRRPSGVVITPHPGEMAHLVGLPEAEVEARAEEIAGEAARRFGVVVALKSARTHLASPDGLLSVHLDEGKIGLATAGSGDVLAGVIAGLLARGADPFAAAAWGVFLHREAGIRLARRLGPIGYLARELLQELPRALAES